jgi:hypothetical protein
VCGGQGGVNVEAGALPQSARLGEVMLLSQRSPGVGYLPFGVVDPDRLLSP